MIIVLRDELFEGSLTDDVELVAAFTDGRDRHKIRLEPAYRAVGTTAFHAWLPRQSVRIQEHVRYVLEQGLKARDFQLPNPEPKVILSRRAVAVWPDSFARGEAVELPLAQYRAIAGRPLRLLLENGRNDWGFLDKIVPPAWKNRWIGAVGAGWVEPEMGAGISELKNIVEQQVALDDVRRLRTWAMFDSDGRFPGHRSRQATAALDACSEWSVAHHLLERRAIENYIPRSTLFDWLRRQPKRPRNRRSVGTAQTAPAEKGPRVEAYLALSPGQRRHYNVKEGFKADAESAETLDAACKAAVIALYPPVVTDPRGPLWGGIHKTLAQDVWGDDGSRYVVGWRSGISSLLFPRCNRQGLHRHSVDRNGSRRVRAVA